MIPWLSAQAEAKLRVPMALVGEGSRGSLAKQLIASSRPDAGRSPPTLVQHMMGWKLRSSPYVAGVAYQLE
jgi:hypothetical protein